jgi:hypothetical protein
MLVLVWRLMSSITHSDPVLSGLVAAFLLALGFAVHKVFHVEHRSFEASASFVGSLLGS